MMPRRQYGGAYGVLASSRALAGSVGPLIGGLIGRYWDIRWVFIWTGVMTLIASAWAMFAVRSMEGAKSQEMPSQSPVVGDGTGEMPPPS
jgi:predicted MFS family arabinose efflux permease